MSISDIYHVSLAVISSLGGGAAIVFGMASWLGKIWANKLLNKDKVKHDKEIESYKTELEKSLSEANSLIEKSIYVTKLQYEKEFSIYLALWKSMVECIIYTKRLFPEGIEQVPANEEEKKKYERGKYNDFVKYYNAFSKLIDTYGPFYDQELFTEFERARKLCSDQANSYETYVIEQMDFRAEERAIPNRQEVYTDFHKIIGNLQHKMQNDIRDYLKRLQTI